ncbi:class I SAM-dependent methyltransferase [Lachnoclostridium phytofermentans]|uniref:Methyltransferase type 11 n=1 Tax=Lachnoclostridium phytofermentans (strain ATCC 700394 / DSM 18823 / ISDg) TaxID=357809 RepID=A9KHP9_LACP7|nr:class I SAM-dependent methyltransferase [Lachnoclostridium phytofermentans]ABX42334.1 Methyltransferase type 11 [Lachnoclostridium phytofermentans ISDg]
MSQNSVNQWYETKDNVNEMKSWKGLKIWEKEVISHFPKNASILNIGCGLGREAFALSDLGFSVVGIDISHSIITEVTALAESTGYSIPFYPYDGRHIPFDDNTFDVIILWAQTFGLLYGADYKQSFFSECNRLLRKDGILSFSGHDYEYISDTHELCLEGRKFYPYSSKEIYWETFLPDELSSYAKQNNFTILLSGRGEIYKPEDGVILHCLCKK